MANTGYGTFDLQRALERNADAFISGVDRRDRREELERLRSDRQAETQGEKEFRREQSKTALETNLKLMEEAENNRIRSEAVKMRVAVKDKDGWRSIEDVQADMHKAEEDQAQTTFDFYTGQLKDITIRADETAERFAKVSSAGAPLELKKQALRTTITSPAMTKLLSGTQMKLAMDAADDPNIDQKSFDNVVEKIRASLGRDYSKFHLFGIGGNFWQETAGNNAAAFQVGYATTLGEPAEKNKLAQWQYLMKQSTEIEDQRLKVLGNMTSHVSQFSNMLPKETVKGFKEWRGVGAPKEMTPEQMDVIDHAQLLRKFPTVEAASAARNAGAKATPTSAAAPSLNLMGRLGGEDSFGSVVQSGIGSGLGALQKALMSPQSATQIPPWDPMVPNVVPKMQNGLPLLPTPGPQMNGVPIPGSAPSSLAPVVPTPTPGNFSTEKPLSMTPQQVDGLKQWVKRSFGVEDDEILAHAADIESTDLTVRAKAIRNFNALASHYLETVNGGESMFAGAVPRSMPGTAPIYPAPSYA